MKTAGLAVYTPFCFNSIIHGYHSLYVGNSSTNESHTRSRIARPLFPYSIATINWTFVQGIRYYNSTNDNTLCKIYVI